MASKRRVVITGLGLVSALGRDPEAMHRELCEGRSGLTAIRLAEGEAELAERLGGAIVQLDAKTILGGRNLRPLDRTSTLAAVATKLAIADSAWDEVTARRHDLGLVLGTMFCSLHTISAFDRRALEAGPVYASPLDFANTVINAAAGQTAIWHGLRGVSSTVSAEATSGLQAIAQASDLVRDGRAGAVLAGGAEELCYEALFGFERQSKVSSDAAQRPRPFDASRDGFAPGEGACLVMLEDAELAAERGARALGEVLGCGRGFDCGLGDEAGALTSEAVRAIRAALAEAAVTPEQIACVSCSADGSVIKDRAEGLALEEVFGGRLSSVSGAAGSDLRVSAILGALGQSLGASGALQTASLLTSLRRRRGPGVIGLERLEEGLPSALAATGWELPGPASTERLLGLVLSLGHGGHAAALVVAAAPGEVEVRADDR